MAFYVSQLAEQEVGVILPLIVADLLRCNGLVLLNSPELSWCDRTQFSEFSVEVRKVVESNF